MLVSMWRKWTTSLVIVSIIYTTPLKGIVVFQYNHVRIKTDKKTNLKMVQN